MRLALIPPTSLLTASPNTNYHLMLPQLVGNWWYSSLFKFRGIDSEQYVILDNGAAEGCDVTPDVLMDCADKYRVDEVVMPDVMYDTLATSIKVIDFLKELQGREHTYKLGLVVTGRSETEAFEFALQMMDQYGDKVDVLYLPRLLVTKENPFTRIDLAQDLLDLFPYEEIHFLGANSLFIREMQEAGKLGIVRGMDTSAPFNYTFHGQKMDEESSCNRPEGYFDLHASKFDWHLLQYNIGLAQEWARGE